MLRCEGKCGERCVGMRKCGGSVLWGGKKRCGERCRIRVWGCGGGVKMWGEV